MNNFSITTQLSQKEYCRLFVRLSYKQRLYQIITIMGVLLLILSVFRFFTTSIVSERTQWFLFCFSVYCLVLFPLIVWLRAKRIYKSNKGLQSTIHYTFGETGLTLNASGIESKFEWKDFSKVQQTSEFILLFGYNRAAYFIKLKDLTQEQIDFIKTKITKK
ncbi:YcxB family protein [Arachidicoccus soli]|uniref:YcxB family protein n=1 Tax=Arachidicoccus soli TaxID=2341117 RepID=A0A386HL38_9BACT|nr:YcxB family protein [Arachidicoccus soli]AYD46339.1 YcxB family protein [Arachidicoccus soli]